MNKYIEKIIWLLKKWNDRSNYSIKISSKEKINLLEQLSNLLNSGIPLINSFKIIWGSKKYEVKNVAINEICYEYQ